MKKLPLLVAIALCLSLQAFSQQNYLDTIWSGGIMRTFRVYIPAIYSGQTPRPLVFQFHGEPGTADAFEDFTRMKSVADTANFILVTPNGTIDPGFPQFGQGWNTFICCRTVNDVLFVSDMADLLQSQYNIDSMQVYGAGLSNGGMMAYELACNPGSKIAAIASVAGTVIKSRLETCIPDRAVPILEIHGTNDPYVPYDGKISGIDTFSAVDTILVHWVIRNMCATIPDVVDLPNTNTSDGSTVQRITWPDCSGCSSVELLKISSTGAEHSWPGLPYPNTNQDIIADREIWNFFMKYRQCEVSATDNIFQSPALSIFPNPSSGFLNLSFPENPAMAGPVSLLISDLYGRILLQQKLSLADQNQPISLDLKAIPAGCYVLMVEDKKGNRTAYRFVIAR
mgnify:CR=1 FL=1